MPDPNHPFTDADRGERLQRVMSDAGIGSRRACEALIEAGEVTVNGHLVAHLPAWVDPEEDRVVVQGRVLPQPERRVYVLLNKPPRTLSTLKDEPGADRRTVGELVDHPLADHLFPVGRLDYDTVGLVLMTNDGELANRLTHPRYGVPKTYRVQVRGALDEDAVAELERGIYLAERKAGDTVGAKRTSKVEITLVHQGREGTTLELTLREGRNRQVRRMMAAVGFPVRKLERVAMGPVQLKGVARGAWRELTREEIRALKKAAAGGSAETTEHDEPGAKRVRKKPAAKKQPVTKQTDRRDAPRVRGTPAPTEPEEPIGPKFSRRTMKNAINRGDRPAGARRRPPEDAPVPAKPAGKKTPTKQAPAKESPDKRAPSKKSPARSPDAGKPPKRTGGARGDGARNAPKRPGGPRKGPR